MLDPVPPSRPWCMRSAASRTTGWTCARRAARRASLHTLAGIALITHSTLEQQAKDEEIVLSSESDAFFRAHMYSNYGAWYGWPAWACLFWMETRRRKRLAPVSFCSLSRSGDLGVAIKGLVDDFQATSKSNANIQSIQDMQARVLFLLFYSGDGIRHRLPCPLTPPTSSFLSAS